MGGAKKAPWRSDAKVEQDLVICRTVVEIFRHPVLSKLLVFRGGTALHKLYFQPPRRYSEDVDMVQIEAGPVGPIFDALRDALTPYLGKPQRKQGPGVVTLTYRISSEMPPVLQLKLKVEINSREHFAALGVRRQAFAVDLLPGESNYDSADGFDAVERGIHHGVHARPGGASPRQGRGGTEQKNRGRECCWELAVRV